MSAKIQAEWLDFIFGVPAVSLAGLSSVARTRRLKAVQQDDLDTGASFNYRGMEPFQTTFTWTMAGNGIRDEIARWEAAIGSFDVLKVGGAQFYPAELQLTQVTASDIRLSPSGDYLTASMTATFSEYVPEKASARKAISKKGVQLRKAPEAQRVRISGSGADIGPTKAEKARKMGGR